MITDNLIEEATGWHKKYNRPVLMSEYGADTIEGLHIVSIRSFIQNSSHWIDRYSCHLSCGPKSTSKTSFLSTLELLIFWGRMLGLLGNLCGTLPISRHNKVRCRLWINTLRISYFIFPEYKRVGGNKKGVFTRNRQPKAAAHYLRKRYFSLAQYLDKCFMPHDLFEYIFSVA